jgi:hypothetical protein
MNETLSTMIAGISYLDREAREAERLRPILDSVVIWLRSVSLHDVSPAAWATLRDSIHTYHRVETTPDMVGLGTQPATAPPRDEDHLQAEFERYFGSPVIAWERWEAWQWAIDALRRSKSSVEAKP